MFTIRRLNHAVLYVRNAERAADFYRGILGFETVEALGTPAGGRHRRGLRALPQRPRPPGTARRVHGLARAAGGARLRLAATRADRHRTRARTAPDRRGPEEGGPLPRPVEPVPAGLR